MSKYLRVKKGEKIIYCIMENDLLREIKGNIYSDYILTNNVYKLDEVKILAPCEPSKIIGIGLNYYDAVKKNNAKVPVEPVVFLKPSSSIISTDEPIIYPKLSNSVTYEVELAVVIGKKTKNVSLENALEYVFGYTIANDVTSKDLLGKYGPWDVGKGFDTFLPVGPWIVTGIDPSNLVISMKQNDETTQISNTKEMIFNVESIISYISSIMTLLPGDIIITGTPAGASELNAGDILVGSIENIGELKNNVLGGI
ncbi:fumarylacetoacetate hydrolase family protein [Clostridium psychrophilum]|uniref:fumarylacetoacetate hydrolase family protein n=1 Tax=Clostridium psychrophilum TaxID=132926 RepID=UPI001C0AB7B0|nr:fumarylacetoacetate hydrolase family protein [Clostridium psychrophilum]MBU3182264.1 fumarylacetoacetate hydrolase family protein [Clostridium psychrophilum]